MSKSVSCPCCGFLTKVKRCDDEICPVCFWQDDGQGDSDAEEVRGGPNKELSLAQARLNFGQFGAAREAWKPHVRLPEPSEVPR